MELKEHEPTPLPGQETQFLLSHTSSIYFPKMNLDDVFFSDWGGRGKGLHIRMRGSSGRRREYHVLIYIGVGLALKKDVSTKVGTRMGE